MLGSIDQTLLKLLVDSLQYGSRAMTEQQWALSQDVVDIFVAIDVIKTAAFA
jgi:hypothetical protein